MFNVFTMMKDMLLAKLSYVLMATIIGMGSYNWYQSRTISELTSENKTLQEENAVCKSLLNGTIEGSEYESSQVEILKEYIKKIQEARADDPCAPLSDDDIDDFFNELRKQGGDSESPSSPNREDAPASNSKRSWSLW